MTGVEFLYTPYLAVAVLATIAFVFVVTLLVCTWGHAHAVSLTERRNGQRRTVIYTVGAVRDLFRRAQVAGLDVTTPGVYDALTVEEFVVVVKKAEFFKQPR
jgi:hypothetical protein